VAPAGGARSSVDVEQVMNTKRCPSCQKLLRADTAICIRCGYEYPQLRSSQKARRADPPPASPHRAGHYSGLHPEDQPYQSSMMFVPPEARTSIAPTSPTGQEMPGQPARVWQAPGNSVLPSVETAPTLVTPQQAEPPVPEQLSPVLPSHLPPVPEQLSPVLPSNLPRRPQARGRAIPIILTICCLFLLIAGSFLAFLFVNRKTPPPIQSGRTLRALPSQLGVGDTLTLTGSGFGVHDPISFTRDVNRPILNGDNQQQTAITDDQGSFSVKVTISSDWEAGQQHILWANDGNVATSVTIMVLPTQAGDPHLQLSSTSIDFGGLISLNMVILTNAGGGKVSWQAHSNQSWLTVTPNSDTFSRGEAVKLLVNRGNLDAGGYFATIEFTQQGSNAPPLVLTVKMAVLQAPANVTPNLLLSNVSLSYSSVQGQAPTDQTITIQNSSSSSALNWSASPTTGDGSNWLSITPSSGSLGGGSSAVLKVSVQSQHLAAGSYTGVISFTGGKNPQVSVSMTVIAPGMLSISPGSLTFQANEGQSQNPAAQKLTLTNSGGEPLDWKLSASTPTSPTWLSATPISGHLEPGATAPPVTVNVNITGLKAGSYPGTLTFSYGSITEQVMVTLTVSPVAIISVQPSSLTFTTTQGTNPGPQNFTITNTGDATLNWSIDQASLPPWLTISRMSDSLAPKQQPETITVTPTNVSQLPAGTVSATITISDSNNPVVKSQVVAVTITINPSPSPSISLSLRSLSCSTTNPTQTFSITNSGTAILDWSIDQTSLPNWLTVSGPNGTLSGTLNPGTRVSIAVTCNSSGLSASPPPAGVNVKESDADTTVVGRSVTVTRTV